MPGSPYAVLWTQNAIASAKAFLTSATAGQARRFTVALEQAEVRMKQPYGVW